MQPVIIAPLLQALPTGGHVLLAGAGGGYDIMGAVPLLLELEAAGYQVHLGSLTFSLPRQLAGAGEKAPGLFLVGPDAATESVYCPEAWLARWLSERGNTDRRVWLWEKSGVATLRGHFERLREALALDAVVLVDGGIDAILRGDETSIGTPAEDLCSLAAARNSGIAHRSIACLGLGAELRDGICHAQVFERVAELTAMHAFIGASALAERLEVGRAYREAVEYVFARQTRQRRSHVHRVVLDAMAGGFGTTAPYVWLSPLLNMYWYFELDAVADTHTFLEHLASTRDIGEVTLFIEGLRKSVGARPKSHIPI